MTKKMPRWMWKWLPYWTVSSPGLICSLTESPPSTDLVFSFPSSKSLNLTWITPLMGGWDSGLEFPVLSILCVGLLI